LKYATAVLFSCFRFIISIIFSYYSGAVIAVAEKVSINNSKSVQGTIVLTQQTRDAKIFQIYEPPENSRRPKSNKKKISYGGKS
jgi:hypothetical protein